MAYQACKIGTEIKMQGCEVGSNDEKVGTVDEKKVGEIDTMQNGKCTWMKQDDALEGFGLIIQATETTRGEAEGGMGFFDFVGIVVALVILCFGGYKLLMSPMCNGGSGGGGNVQMKQTKTAAPSQPPKMDQLDEVAPEQPVPDEEEVMASLSPKPAEGEAVEQNQVVMAPREQE